MPFNSEPEMNKSLFDAETHREIVDRINALTADTGPTWGEMSAAQMLAHCAEVQEVSNGTKVLRDSPFMVRLIRGLIKKMVISDKPYPRSTRTHPQYVVSDQKDFDEQKQRLIDGLNAAVSMSDNQINAIEHALFGRMTKDEKGWSMYKHLDHHLSQFGV